jgi:pimeloyl-ACP methyl ester carboxylesterase
MRLRLPEEFSHKTIQLPDLKVHYVREGSGPPLILWHGWPGFWWDFRYIIGPLSEHFDVIVPDFRGSGDTEKTDLNDISKYSMDQLAEDQAAFLDALAISQCYFIAHDWGSMVAHKFIRRHREKLIKGIIFDPVTPFFEVTEGTYTQEDWYALFNQLDVALDLISLNRESRRIYYAHFLNSWSYRKPLLTDQELEIVIDNYMKPGNVHGGLNYDRSTLAPDSEPWSPVDFEVSDIPVTILWAEHDPSVPISASPHLPKLYSNYTLEALSDSGHHIAIEKPGLVVERALKAFV